MTNPTNKSTKNALKALKEYIKSNDLKNDVKDLRYILKYLTLGTACAAAPADIYFFLLWAEKNATGNETLKNIAIANGITSVALLVGVFIFYRRYEHLLRNTNTQNSIQRYGPAIKNLFTKLKNKLSQTYTQHNTKIK